MAGNSVNGSGNGARSGAQTLVLLATPINCFVLNALREGAKQQVELRRVAGSPAQTTLRAQLKRLSEIGAIERRRQNRFPGVLEYELTPSGRELLFVLDVLQHWLDQAPHEPLPLGSGSAKAAVKALTEAWSTTMLRALGAGPLSLTELDGVIGSLSYPALERRLTAMRLTGMIEARTGDGRGTPYAVTDWLRIGIAPLAAAARWERRNLSDGTAPTTPIDIETTFLLTVPRLRSPNDLSGSCRLAVEVSNGSKRRLAGVVAKAGAHGSIGSCTTTLDGPVDGWALGSAAAWLNALIDHDTDGLELGGDGHLARAFLTGLHEMLFQVSEKHY